MMERNSDGLLTVPQFLQFLRLATAEREREDFRSEDQVPISLGVGLHTITASRFGDHLMDGLGDA